MKKSFLFLFLTCILLIMIIPVFGDEKGSKLPILVKQGNNIDSFVPNGWKLLTSTRGDLNNDGLNDIAGVIEDNKKNIEEAPSRILFIAFREKDQYQLSIQTEKAILKSDQGGIWGDPLDSISVNRGSILINFYGGSNWRWAYCYRFRFQNNGWYLIGATIDSYFTGTGEGTTKDYNLLTGFMIDTTVDKDGKKQEKTINREKKGLLSLKSFDADVLPDDKQF